MIGLKRSFEKNLVEVRKEIDEGRIGKVEMVKIKRRDKGEKNEEYIKV